MDMDPVRDGSAGFPGLWSRAGGRPMAAGALGAPETITAVQAVAESF